MAAGDNVGGVGKVDPRSAGVKTRAQTRAQVGVASSTGKKRSASTTSFPANPKTKKQRTRRKDIYDLPDDSGEESAESATRAHERSEVPIPSQKATRATSRKSNDNVQVLLPSPKKSKAGRPPKKNVPNVAAKPVSPSPQVEDDDKSGAESDHSRDQPEQNLAEDELEVSEDGQEGQTKGRPEREPEQEPEPATNPLINHEDEKSESEVDDLTDDDDDDDDDDEGSNNDAPDHKKPIFDIRIIARMRETAGRVGKLWNKEESRFDEVETHDEPTEPKCSSLFTELRRLIGIYRAHDFESDENVVSIRSLLSGLQNEIANLISDIRPKRRRDQEALDILKDVYFCVLPKLVHAVHVAATAHTLEETVSRNALKEILKLAKMYQQLSEAALSLSSKERRKDTHPAVKAKNYLFVLPTQRNKSLVERLCLSLEGELDRRIKAKQRAEHERLELKLEKGRKRLIAIANREMERRVKETHNAQKVRIQQAFSHPILGPMMKAEIAKALGQGSQRQSSARPPRRSETVNEPLEEDDGSLPGPHVPAEYDFFDYDDDKPVNDRVEEGDEDEEEGGEEEEAENEEINRGVERVEGVFEKNNNRQKDLPKPWSKEDEIQFIECMKSSNDPGRYGRLAEALERSMDDVFAKAKDFQTTMDTFHSKNKFTGEGDEWTRYVYVPEDWS